MPVYSCRAPGAGQAPTHQRGCFRPSRCSCPAESSELRGTCLPAGLFKQAREIEPRWEKAFFGLADYQDCLYQDARARQESRKAQHADRLMGKGRWVCLTSTLTLSVLLAECAASRAAEFFSQGVQRPS